MSEDFLGKGAPTAREPAFNAPWPAVAAGGRDSRPLRLQSLGNPEGPILKYGFSPAELANGQWGGLFTALFVHGGWPHALLNGLGALAFGAPVAEAVRRGRARGSDLLRLLSTGGRRSPTSDPP